MSHKIVVLGGGISGLAAAWFLRQRGGDVTLLEASSRVGGYVETVREKGFLFELGPRSCRAYGNGVETLGLIEALGLQSQVVVAAPCSRKRFLYTQHRLRPIPQGPLSFLASSLTRPLLWPLLCEWRIPASGDADESIHAFVERRLGQYAANTFIDPLVSGIFAGDPKKLSVKSCFPFLYRWERDKGSIIRGLLSRKSSTQSQPSAFVNKIAGQGMFSLRGGMQQLTDTLQQRLGPLIRTNCPITALDLRRKSVLTSDGTLYEADHIVSALPAPVLGSLMVPHDQELARLLTSVSYASVAVVAFGFHRRILERQGFGYLIPSQEGERVLGVVWDSSVFPQQDNHHEETRLTCMIGGEQMPNFDSYEPQDFVTIALEALGRHMGINIPPDAIAIKVAKAAIPQYSIGHEARLAAIRERIALLTGSLTLVGNSFDGVAVNDCIAHAKAAANGIVFAIPDLVTNLDFDPSPV